MFGGQVAAQALVAAGRTVPEDREVHSLHAYFIRPGDPRVPIVYETERVRDGRSFTTRRVLAIQHGEPIFSLSASFQLPADGLAAHASPPPWACPRRTRCPGSTRSPRRRRARWLTQGPRPLDMRFVEPAAVVGRVRAAPPTSPLRVWMRADGTLPDDRLLHVCMLTYVSDLTLLGSVLVRHDRADGPVQMASLDHAMWFHRPFRADEWLLYTCYSPFAGGGRGPGHRPLHPGRRHPGGHHRAGGPGPGPEGRGMQVETVFPTSDGTLPGFSPCPTGDGPSPPCS